MRFRLGILELNDGTVQLDVNTAEELTGEDSYLVLLTAFQALKEKDPSILINVMFSAVEILQDQPKVVMGLKNALNILEKNTC